MLLAAFLLGLLGSFHCLGMCGPLILAFPPAKQNTFRQLGKNLIYNTGRIATYVVLGLLFGFLGKSLHVAGLQSWVSVLCGVLMLLIVLLPLLLGRKGNSFFAAFGMNRFVSVMQQLLKSKSPWAFFLIGLFNGLLPCGLVYVALAASLATGNTVSAVLFMLFFGLGTIPMLFAVVFAGNFLKLRFRNAIQKIIPFLICFAAVLLILRGLSLGIPYISPKAGALTPQTTHDCCHN